MVMRLKVAISGPASVNAGGTLEKELAYGLPKLLVSWKFQGSIIIVSMINIHPIRKRNEQIRSCSCCQVTD
jgi:hypothetical protein